MRDSRQHRCALIDLPADAVTHIKECPCRLPHFTCPFNLEVGKILPLAEFFSGERKTVNGPDLIAHKDHRNSHQHNRAANQPEDKDISGRTDQTTVIADKFDNTVAINLHIHLEPSIFMVGCNSEGICKMCRESFLKFTLNTVPRQSIRELCGMGCSFFIFNCYC